MQEKKEIKFLCSIFYVEEEIMNYYNEIKEQILHNEITKSVKDYSKNRSDLETYYNIGKILFEAGKHYGEGIIKEYSKRLTKEFGKGYGISSLKNMRKFYHFSKSHAVRDLLSWTHYKHIMTLKNESEINYYIHISLTQNLTERDLFAKIKNKEYERLPEETKLKLIKKEETKLEDLMKDPILIRNPSHLEIVSEKALHKLIMENIEHFMKELGNAFSFVGSEYKIKVGNTYNYIDFLLFNYEYNSFVVVELKIGELKKEHLGQIQLYMNYVDKMIRKINQDKTIGIILCKKGNRFVMEYCSDERILAKEYELV